MPNCQLVIDGRERIETGQGPCLLVQEIKKLRTFNAGELGISQLPLGDAIVLQEGECLRACWERKTCSDFVASLNDGRMENQKARLVKAKQEAPGTVFGLILEGSLEKTDVGAQNRNHVRHLIWEWSKYDLVVVYTANVEETCEYLVQMRWSFSQEPSMSDAQYETLLKMHSYVGKKNAVTPANYHAECLKMIPGITGKHAQAIVEKYPTRSLLAAAFQNNPNLLKGLKIDEKRNIGSALSRKLQSYVLENS